MYRVSTNISKEKFQSMISENKSYVPSQVRRALQEGRKSNLLFKKSVRKDEALAAMKYLIKQGVISGYKSPHKLVRTAAREQWKEEQKKKEEKKEKKQAKKEKKGAKEKKEKKEAEEKAKIQHRLKTYLLLERDEELAAEEKGKRRIEYDPRSVLGKSILEEENGELEGLEGEDQGIKRVEYAPGGDLPKSVSEEIEEKKKKREKKVASEQEKIQEFFNPKSVKPKKPDLVDIDNLPDMDID